jgi:ABC-type branched-subunit amino acid transport system ATPase component
VAILERIGLAAARDKMPGELPFGQQKLVGLARTLMNDGEVLLLDEPMAGRRGASLRDHQEGGARRGGRGARSLRGRAQRVLHPRPVHRAVFMFNGRIEQTGTVEELLASEKLGRALLWREKVRAPEISNRHFGALWKFTALSDVSFSVGEGARVAIFGHNGAGKTTLLKCAVGGVRRWTVRYIAPERASSPARCYRNTRLGIGFRAAGPQRLQEPDVERNLRIAGLLHDAATSSASTSCSRCSPSGARSSRLAVGRPAADAGARAWR